MDILTDMGPSQGHLPVLRKPFWSKARKVKPETTNEEGIYDPKRESQDLG
jgi:hypothetical protein